MNHKIITQTQKEVKKLLDKQQEKQTLKNLKHARYMREEYSKRKKRLNLTFDPDQFKQIKKEADQVGITPTAFLRESMLAYMNHQRLPSRKTEEKFSELIFLMRNIANNLNQIARQANTLQKLSIKDFVQTRVLLKKLETTTEHFMNQL